MMVVALDASGALARIEQVARGLACCCTCVSCKGPLIARQGEINAWSFAHVSGGDCGARESQAHLFGKQIIEAAGGLHLASRKKWGAIDSDFQPLDEIVLEQRFGDVRPDLLCSYRGAELAIEIKVTHACTPRKLAIYRSADISVLEIDLSSVRHKRDEELATAVLRTAPRHWLHRSGGRLVPSKPPEIGSLKQTSTRFARPKGMRAEEWQNMGTLEKVEAVYPASRERKMLESKHATWHGRHGKRHP
ncbi:competence protein CoiA family protein [Novosphingobium pentaromativorans]|nr:competence protein CoiA family protein [Novosphingobium pentaromativorans]